MSLLYPNITWATENRLTKYVQKSQTYVDLTVPLCEPCNTGWMSDLEHHAKRLLVPMVEGQRIILGPQDQAVLKSWFFLRAIVHDMRSEKSAPRPRYFKDEECRQLATTLACFPYYEFFLARFDGRQPGLIDEDNFDTVFYRGATEQFEGNVTRGYSMTLVFKHLVLQILCIKSPERLTHRLMSDWRAICFQFGEPFAINSFPPFHFNDDTIHSFVERWSKDMQMFPFPG